MINFDIYQALSFDCYGTLIDWNAGITEAGRVWLDSAGAADAVSQDDLIASFAHHERIVQRETPAMRYSDVLSEALKRMGRDLGIRVTDEDAATFGGSVGDWPAFPDSTAALRLLAERFKLIVLSNVDRSSFARTNERLGVRFDVVVTAEDVGAYKPDPKMFDTLLATADGMGVPKHALLHVGESLYHDVEPCVRDQIDVALISRPNGQGGVQASGRDGDADSSAQPLAVYETMADFAKAAMNGGFG